MKRFITAMLFSLTVIVCQQQTLFAAAIDEALRNCVAVGAEPDRVAILDNFCWGTVSYQSNVASVTADSEEGPRGIPVAGALRDSGYFTGMVGNLNGRLIPVAESFVTSNVDLAFTPNERLNVVDPYACPNDRIASGSNLHHTFEDYIMDPADDPNFILDDMPFLELDSSLLPWHGR